MYKIEEMNSKADLLTSLREEMAARSEFEGSNAFEIVGGIIFTDKKQGRVEAETSIGMVTFEIFNPNGKRAFVIAKHKYVAMNFIISEAEPVIVTTSESIFVAGSAEIIVRRYSVDGYGMASVRSSASDIVSEWHYLSADDIEMAGEYSACILDGSAVVKYEDVREIAAAVYEAARKRYDECFGWSEIVECFTIDELVDEINEAGLKSAVEAISYFEKNVALRNELNDEICAA